MLTNSTVVVAAAVAVGTDRVDWAMSIAVEWDIESNVDPDSKRRLSPHCPCCMGCTVG